jgi:hypothetical protein
VKNQDSIDKTNFFLSTRPSTTWFACRSFLENIGKMSLIPIFNKNLPQVHTELELDALGVYGKLVKYVVHSFKRKN